jgi:uncharacterized phiE125 gp8 family phage protein
MAVKVVTDVTTEPLTAAYLKNYLKYDEDSTDETTLLASMAKAARIHGEMYTERAFAEKIVLVSIHPDDLSEIGEFELPFAPHGTVSAVKSYDLEGTETAKVLNTDYYLIGHVNKTIRINTSVSLTTEEAEYTVQYTCGYGITSTTESLPEDIKIAMAQLVAYWWRNRGDNEALVPTKEFLQTLWRYKMHR